MAIGPQADPAVKSARRLARRLVGLWQLAHPRRRVHTQRALSFEQLDGRFLLAASPVLTMSDADQLLVEFINRARANPAAEAARYHIDLNAGLPAGTISAAAKPALAPQQALIDMAELHTQWMLDNDSFTHDGPAGQTVGKRATEFGYAYNVIGENIGWIGNGAAADPLATAVAALHENLFRSERHRANLLRADFTEIGVGVRSGPFRDGGVLYQATMVTVDFGSRGGSQYFTGVAYEDSTAEPAFALGQGRNSVTVTAVAVDGSGTFTTTTGVSGGYALAVPPGTYDLKAQGAALPQSIEHKQVTLGTGNVKVDFVAGQTTSLGVSDDVAMCGPGQSVSVVVLANDTGPAALHPELVQIVDAPQHGVATANPATGEVSYVPELGYLGLDRFTYRVADTQGNPTAPAQVQITVLNPVYHPWKNPQLAADVNGDGYITPLDALQLINRLNAQAPGSLPTPSPQGSFPLPYLDVNGDADVTAMDALVVINLLNSPASGEGEFAAATALWPTPVPVPATRTASRQAQGAPAEAGAQAIHLVRDSTTVEQPAFDSPLARKIDERQAEQESQ